MTESNKIVCKICKQMKTRILIGKYPDGRNKKYADENGKLFSGKTCPQCQAERTKMNMKKMRFEKAVLNAVIQEAGEKK